MVATQSSPARPGDSFGFLDSSPSVKQVSQPQKANTEPVTPMTNAIAVKSVNGLNQLGEKRTSVGAV